MDQVAIQSTKLAGLFIITTPIFKDNRGTFTKVFNNDVFAQHKLDTDFKESYYSISKKNVIRGMHFQLPPHDHSKLVFVPYGVITDVVLDIRKGSKTFGRYESFTLSQENGISLYISPGLAHGFKSEVDNSCITYLQTTTHSPEHDKGIKYDSFDMTWNTVSPIISERDQTFPSLAIFKTPFI